MNRHPVNIAHLVMGLAFLCFAAGWALVQADVVTGGDIRWLLPIPWLVAGAAGLAAITVGSLRRTPPADPADPADPASTAVHTTRSTTTDPQEES